MVMLHWWFHAHQ